jgi:hypothetical protein
VTRIHAQLLLYRFPPGSDLEGQLVGALERVETGASLRVLELLFVLRDETTGEASAIAAHGNRAGGFIEPLLEFRLNPGSRGAATKRVLASPTAGPLARELETMLERGEAIAAVLVEHAWRGALESAVERTGGTVVADEHVAAGDLSDVAPAVLGALAQQRAAGAR